MANSIENSKPEHVPITTPEESRAAADYLENLESGEKSLRGIEKEADFIKALGEIEKLGVPVDVIDFLKVKAGANLVSGLARFMKSGKLEEVNKKNFSTAEESMEAIEKEAGFIEAAGRLEIPPSVIDFLIVNKEELIPELIKFLENRNAENVRVDDLKSEIEGKLENSDIN